MDQEYRIHPCVDGGFVVFSEDRMRTDSLNRCDAFAGDLDACLAYIKTKLTAPKPSETAE
jgi:hypothetical protein